MVDKKDELMMAQAVADAIGATKRQVQLWTDAGVIQCLPDTDRQGRGSQRLYSKDELPTAALVAAAAKAKLPIGILKRFAENLRLYTKTDAYSVTRDRGYIVFEVPDDPNEPQDSWIFYFGGPAFPQEEIEQLSSAVVINVNKVMADLKK